MKKFIFSLFIIFTLAVTLFSQAIPLSGRVTNSSGNGVGSVLITALGGNCPGADWNASARTGPFGYYSMDVAAAKTCDAMAVFPTHHSFTIFTPAAYVYDFNVTPLPSGFVNVDFVAIS